jgi:hypothetical protein
MTFSRKYTSVLSFERWYYVSGWLNVLRSENKAPRGRDKGRDRGPETHARSLKMFIALASK